MDCRCSKQVAYSFLCFAVFFFDGGKISQDVLEPNLEQKTFRSNLFHLGKQYRTELLLTLKSICPLFPEPWKLPIM